MSDTRILPDGKVTDSLEEYLVTWINLAKPLARIGWTLSSFDPQFTFLDQRGSRVELTFEQVKDLVGLIDP